MKVWLKDDSFVEAEIAADILWDLVELSRARRIEVYLLVTRKGRAARIDLLAAIDADRTFGEVIIDNFPSLPPDTEEDPVGLEPHEISRSTRPRFDTMPCRER